MKKLGLLIVALLVGLGSLGVSYSLWTDSLALSTTMNTGTWHGVFAAAVSSDEAAQAANDPTSSGGWSWTSGNLTLANWTPGTNSGHNYADTNITSGVGTPNVYASIILNQTTTYSYTPSIGMLVNNTGTTPVRVSVVVTILEGPASGISSTSGGIFTVNRAILPGSSALGVVNLSVPAHAPGTFTARIALAVTPGSS